MSDERAKNSGTDPSQRPVSLFYALPERKPGPRLSGLAAAALGVALGALFYPCALENAVIGWTHPQGFPLDWLGQAAAYGPSLAAVALSLAAMVRARFGNRTTDTLASTWALTAAGLSLPLAWLGQGLFGGSCI